MGPTAAQAATARPLPPPVQASPRARSSPRGGAQAAAAGTATARTTLRRGERARRPHFRRVAVPRRSAQASPPGALRTGAAAHALPGRLHRGGASAGGPTAPPPPGSPHSPLDGTYRSPPRASFRAVTPSLGLGTSLLCPLLVPRVRDGLRVLRRHLPPYAVKGYEKSETQR
nr:PREDICTED: atherin-like [Rhinolophus sinicus]